MAFMRLIETLLPALVGLVGVSLGAWLTSKRTSKERITDLRRQTYGVILSELWEAERLCDVVNEYISQTDEMYYFHSPESSRHNAKISDRMRAAYDRFTSDYLIVSDQFRSLYDAMIADISDDPNELPPEEHESFDAAIRKHRPLLLAQARKETAT